MKHEVVASDLNKALEKIESDFPAHEYQSVKVKLIDMTLERTNERGRIDFEKNFSFEVEWTKPTCCHGSMSSSARPKPCLLCL